MKYYILEVGTYNTIVCIDNTNKVSILSEKGKQNLLHDLGTESDDIKVVATPQIDKDNDRIFKVLCDGVFRKSYSGISCDLEHSKAEVQDMLHLTDSVTLHKLEG